MKQLIGTSLSVINHRSNANYDVGNGIIYNKEV